jgi:hypothetical protein
MTGSVDNPAGKNAQYSNHNGLVMQGNSDWELLGPPLSTPMHLMHDYYLTKLIISNSNNIFLINIIYNLNYLILPDPISGLFPESYSYPVYMQYDMIWHANADMSRICWSIYRMHMTGQIGSQINFGQKTPQFRFSLKTVLFSVWVPNSEERKSNPRKPYLRVLVRIAKSLYSGGITPASGSASAYVGSGVTSYPASGSESTISPNINLNWVSVSFLCDLI